MLNKQFDKLIKFSELIHTTYIMLRVGIINSPKHYWFIYDCNYKSTGSTSFGFDGVACKWDEVR